MTDRDEVIGGMRVVVLMVAMVLFAIGAVAWMVMT